MVRLWCLLANIEVRNMLIKPQSQRGITLIEIVVGIAIIAALMATALPSFKDWIQSSKIRTTAESIQNGLQIARAEAVSRNTLVSFSLTDSTTAACALSASGTSWVVSLDDPSGKCNVTDPLAAPRIVQVKSGGEGANNVVVAAGQSAIVFNGLGRITPTPGAAITIAMTNPTGGTCAKDGGEMRCMNISISIGGQVRMCDPALASTDPRGC